MKTGSENGKSMHRRDLLTSVAVGGTALGLGGLLTGQSAPEQGRHASSSGVEVAGLARLRDYQNRRSSSYDRTGGNDDFVSIEPGQTITLHDTAGPGIITHVWFTINSDEDFHLKKLVLRAYWDGEKEPSVEVPVGDFFGLGLGQYFSYQSAITSVASVKALNAYFPMPFNKSARVTVSNEGEKKTDNFYYNIDYVILPELHSEFAYFHAQYLQAAPCRGWTSNWHSDYEPSINGKKNLSGEGNYVMLEAKGRGHFVGVMHSILQNQDGWAGEGDEMIFIDDLATPVILGTGSEDYYNGAWNFGGSAGAQPFAYMHNGAPYIVDPERIGGRYCLYRWHLESPISFQKSIRVTIEHGHANHRSDNFYSTACWYQTEPHATFPRLPKPEKRIPRVFQAGGPGVVSFPAEK